MGTTSPAPPARPSLLLACSALLLGCPGPSAQPYQIVEEHLREGLLSVSGTSARDVWVVGSDAGEGPLVLHWDGSSWQRRASGTRGDLWWVHAISSETVLVGGEGGTIARWNGSAFEAMSTPSRAPTVFGIWAAAEDDIYAVGGLGGTSGFVWHYDGSAWSALDTIPFLDPTMPPAIFKVWGRGPDDVWICGFAGTLMHFDGAAWARVESGTSRTILTLHAIEGAIAAVGGAGTGVLVEPDPAGRWHEVAPELTPQLMGVWLTPEGGRASGINGTILRREGGAWSIEDHGLDLAEHLHSVWIDPEGGVWSVGGRILAEPFDEGIILYQGSQSVSATGI